MTMLDAMKADISEVLMTEHRALINAIDCACDCHSDVDGARAALVEFLTSNPVVSEYYKAVDTYHRNQSEISDSDIFAQFV